MRDPYEHSRDRFDIYASLGGQALPVVPRADLSRVQVQLARWQNRNFPGAEIQDPALGVAEELGELAASLMGLMSSAGSIAFSILKDRQKIRGFGQPEVLRRALADAIADTAIFLMQLATWCRLDFAALIEATADRVMLRDWRKDAETGGQK